MTCAGCRNKAIYHKQSLGTDNLNTLQQTQQKPTIGQYMKDHQNPTGCLQYDTSWTNQPCPKIRTLPPKQCLHNKINDLLPKRWLQLRGMPPKHPRNSKSMLCATLYVKQSRNLWYSSTLASTFTIKTVCATLDQWFLFFWVQSNVLVSIEVKILPNLGRYCILWSGEPCLPSTLLARLLLYTKIYK